MDQLKSVIKTTSFIEKINMKECEDCPLYIPKNEIINNYNYKQNIRKMINYKKEEDI